MTKAMQQQIEVLGVHPVFGSVGNNYGIEQNAWELAEFLDQIPPIESVLEIGTGHKAGLARFMSEIMHWNVTSVDKDIPQFLPTNVQFIHLPSSDAIETILVDSFDLVIIDANHSYEAVMRDYELYAPLASRAIMLHDIAGLRDCEGVANFWKEIAYTKKGNLRKGYHEIIADSRERAGIGWIEK